MVAVAPYVHVPAVAASAAAASAQAAHAAAAAATAAAVAVVVLFAVKARHLEPRTALQRSGKQSTCLCIIPLCKRLLLHQLLGFAFCCKLLLCFSQLLARICKVKLCCRGSTCGAGCCLEQLLKTQGCLLDSASFAIMRLPCSRSHCCALVGWPI